ncbi:B3 domain-containing transcription factor LEC2-like, partial [Cynara cardunculus var. scolymus]|uniref:B3 domain-containing transcription factor LEC2-like n=1 Tax=Cynara cardunculus var. scolymus TaxID=59895 RepID=UPI000D62AA1D
MENSNGFLSKTSKPCPDFPTQDSQKPYPCTSGMRNSESPVCLNLFPVAVSSIHPIQPLHIPESGESKKLQAKIARSNRKKAREMTTNKTINPSISSSLSSPSSSIRSAIIKSTKPHKSSDQDHCIFYTPNKVKLSFVLQKLLTHSDVKEQSRILLPKREAEENLPRLDSKEGIRIVMKDVVSNEEWKMQYRFWANQKGRMYLLDQSGDFVKKNKLEVGDQLKLYQDELRNL